MKDMQMALMDSWLLLCPEAQPIVATLINLHLQKRLSPIPAAKWDSSAVYRETSAAALFSFQMGVQV